MKAKSEQPLSSELLAAYLDGEVTAHEATRIERALEACSTNRRHLEELRRIRDALAAPAPELEELDLVAAVRKKAQLPASGRARFPVFGALAAVAGVAAVSLVIAASRQDLSSSLDQDQEFRAKAASSAAAQERWTGIRIYRVVAHQVPERVTESLNPRDTLLFSYTNLGPDPFEYLMVFAIGADQRVHWFYPAYEAASENPLSVSIEPGTSMLPDAVEHDYSEGDLEVYALFSHRPEQVSRIEAWVSARAESRKLDAAPIPGATLRRVGLRVRP